MPEVGGKFAKYVNPEDVNKGYALVRDLLANPEEIERWSREIATSYKPKTWDQFSVEFFDAATDISRADEHPGNRLIEAADIVGMGTAEINRRDALDEPLTYLAGARQKGWHPVEPWGCWTASRAPHSLFRRASLRIRQFRYTCH